LKITEYYADFKTIGELQNVTHKRCFVQNIRGIMEFSRFITDLKLFYLKLRELFAAFSTVLKST
jgi:hypothetical protein